MVFFDRNKGPQTKESTLLNYEDRRPLIDNAISIDQGGTRTRDDAIHHVYIPSDHQHVIRFYIADVPYHVACGSELDEAAVRRTDQNIFPKEYLCRWSLEKENDHPAVEFSFFMDDEMGTVQKLDILLVDVKLRDTYTFEYVSTVLSNPRHKENEFFASLLDVSKALSEHTKTQINFGPMRRKVQIGERILGEFALHLNRELARYCMKAKVPIMYRNTFSVKYLPEYVKKKYHEVRNTALSRREKPPSLGSTMLSHVPRYHKGLEQVGYAEFSSPLRSWVSLVNLRQIRAHMLGMPLPYSEAQIREFVEVSNLKSWEHFFAVRS